MIVNRARRQNRASRGTMGLASGGEDLAGKTAEEAASGPKFANVTTNGKGEM